MILTSSNKKTLTTLSKKLNLINLYQKIEHLIFDCENIFDYLGFKDCINLSLVNKNYNHKHNKLITSYDPNMQIENIFIKYFTEQNKLITEDNKKRIRITKTNKRQINKNFQ